MDEKIISQDISEDIGEIMTEKKPTNQAAKTDDASKKITPKTHPHAAVSGHATHDPEKKAAPVEKPSKLTSQKFAGEVATSIDQLNQSEEQRQKTGVHKPRSHASLPASQTGR